MKKVVLAAALLALSLGTAHAKECYEFVRVPEYRGSTSPLAIEAAASLAQMCQLQYLSAAIAVANQKLAIAEELVKDIRSSALLRLLKKATVEERRYKDLADKAAEKERVIRGQKTEKETGFPRAPKRVPM